MLSVNGAITGANHGWRNHPESCPFIPLDELNLRFPRDLRLDDLKGANAVLIGSVGSNPWAGIAEKDANFHIVYGQGREGATIIKANPQPGKQASYESHWNDPAHETFALIAFLPNMDDNGHLLLLQRLDVAGTVDSRCKCNISQTGDSCICREATFILNNKSVL